MKISFETIRNSTALKQRNVSETTAKSFETIRNSTALKREVILIDFF